MKQVQRGFTLIEILITLVIGMVILAGMTSVFVSQTRIAAVMNGKTSAMGDLFLASQVMQSELRSARAMCWDAVNNKLLYQPLDSTVVLPAACDVLDVLNGSFELRSNMPIGDRLCWDRPNDASGCQELIRGLIVPVITVIPTTNANIQAVRSVTINSKYKDVDKSIKSLGLSFKVWPRNP